MGNRLICSGILFFCPLALAAETAEREHTFFSSRTQYFEIVSNEGASTNFTAALARSLIHTTRNWLRLPSGFPNRIFVQLESPERYRFEEPFRTNIEVAGNVTLSVRWDRETELEDLERALVRALLMRVAIWNRVPDESVSVPPWLEMGMQRTLQAAGDPSYVDAMVRSIRERGPMPLREILYRNEDEPPDEAFAVNAYWLLRHLDQAGGQSGRLHNFVLRLLAGGDPDASMMATFGSYIREIENAQLWWAVGVYERIQRRAVTQSHFHESRRLVNSHSRFTYRKEGEEVRLGVDELWEHRDEPVLRSDLVRRLQDMNLQMRLIHPFHFNSILSLRLTMMSLLEGTEEEYRRGVAMFRDDVREADLLFRETEEALDRLEEEIRPGD